MLIDFDNKLKNFKTYYKKNIFLILILYIFNIKENLIANNNIQNCILVHFNDTIITKSDIKERMRLISFFNRIKFDDILKNEEFINSTITSLIDERILLNKAKSLKITPDDEQIELAINNFFINISGELNNKESIKKFLKENNLKYEILKDFVLNEILILKYFEYYKDKINTNEESHELLKKFLKTQTKDEYENYNLIEFKIQNTNNNINEIKNCLELKEYLESNSIIFDEYTLETKLMNDEFLNQVKLQGDKKIGFLSFKEKNNQEDSEENNFIAFCPNGRKKKFNINLNNIQIENFLLRNKINKLITDIIDENKLYNSINFNKKCTFN